jgi:anion-transporting  ArsA/GET3 family ATPase
VITELLKGKRVCICAGSGGVGKTTVSAAIALGMAARGARVAVVTIDPANRLADALGIDQLDNELHRVAPPADSAAAPGWDGAGAEVPGELWAMMLDPKRTFDELIERLAPDPARAEEIKANRVYRELSSAVSGSQEFTAVAKLYELDQSGFFDLLVLDTPPSRNALDFLEAPRRLSSFLEGRMMQAFVRPTGLGMRVLGVGTTPLLGALRRVTGVDLVADLGRFFQLLAGMTQGFSQRAAGVQELLHAPTTAFLLVTSPEREPIDEAIWFHRTVQREGFPVEGVIVNRVHHDLLSGGPNGGDQQPQQVGRGLARILSPDLSAKVAANFVDYHLLAERDDRNISRLVEALDGQPLVLVPHLDEDVHDLDGLLAVRRYLFSTGEERERLIAELVA